MKSGFAHIMGFAAASAFVGSFVALMIIWGRWDAEALAIIMAMSLPLYVVARDSARRRDAIHAWRPPWER